MSTRAWLTVIIILGVIIVALGVLLFATPVGAPGTSPQPTTTTQAILPSPSSSSTSTAPLDTQVTVTSPAASSTVGHTFTVAGTAPGPWFFEAVFPIQVRDENDDLIGSSQGRAQGEWTTDSLVTFTSQMTVDASYHGPATLILLKDNPSGLPQNMDEVTVPIVVQ